MGINRAALEGPQSPDQLNRTIRITSARGWIAVACLAVAAAFTLAWSLLGAIQTQVSGLGMILPDRGKVYTVASVVAGSVGEVLVEVGQKVSVGDHLIRVIQDEEERMAAERDLAVLRQLYDQAEARSQALIEDRRQTNVKTLATYAEQTTVLNAQAERLRQGLAQLEADLNRGFITRDEVDQARKSIDDLVVQIQGIEEKILEANINLAEFISDQNQTLATRKEELDKQEVEVERIKAEHQEEEVLTAAVDGVISEISVAKGDQVEKNGTLINLLAVDNSPVVDAFFKQADGKRVAEGMAAYLSVSSANASIYGTALGKVTYVSALPATDAFLSDLMGNEELTKQMTADGAPIHVRIAFIPDPKTPSGLAWSSSNGPPFTIGTGTLVMPSITVSSQPPINYLAPLLPAHVGLSDGDGR